MVSPDQVEAMIKAELPDALVYAQSSDGEHYEVTVVSSQFQGKRLVQQHQLVYGAVRQAIDTNVLHALALKTYTPESWAATGGPV
ncbi:BolA family protein [Kamptonema formosum]|uniref:BolA family protein n=1 Tax=Kamptonema formosum TaxID=331992 RepID=UPI00034713EF|nr:BolA family transcriptional regulator [Oscillatoria sp. PCC 10802]